MNKDIIVGTVLVIVAGAGYWGLAQQAASQRASDEQVVQSSMPVPGDLPPAPEKVVETSFSASGSAATVESAPVPKQVKTYAMSEVARHASSMDCWVVVGGKVFDVTMFIPGHPGGAEAIIRACGTDATRVFGSQDDHVEVNAWKQLQAFYIGDVK